MATQTACQRQILPSPRIREICADICNVWTDFPSLKTGSTPPHPRTFASMSENHVRGICLMHRSAAPWVVASVRFRFTSRPSRCTKSCDETWVLFSLVYENKSMNNLDGPRQTRTKDARSKDTTSQQSCAARRSRCKSRSRTRHDPWYRTVAHCVNSPAVILTHRSKIAAVGWRAVPCSILEKEIK